MFGLQLKFVEKEKKKLPTTQNLMYTRPVHGFRSLVKFCGFTDL